MAQKINITIDQGADYSSAVTVNNSSGTPIDLTGYTGAGSLKKWFTANTVASFDISINGPTGVVIFSLSKSISKDLSGRYVFDITATETSSNTTIRVAEGIATVNPGVTLNN